MRHPRKPADLKTGGPRYPLKTKDPIFPLTPPPPSSKRHPRSDNFQGHGRHIVILGSVSGKLVCRLKNKPQQFPS